MKPLILALLMALAVSCSSNEPQNTPITYGDTIALPQPAPQGGLTINEALWLRASSREYAATPLSLEELGGVMWAAAGINRPENSHLTAPSAMAVYSVDVYAFTPEGVYRYDAATHTLVRCGDGDHRELSAMQEFAYTAPLNLVYIADMAKYERFRMAPEQSLHYAGMDAAGYAENVNLYAAGHGLKSITRGLLRREEVLTLLGLGDHYKVVLSQTVGK